MSALPLPGHGKFYDLNVPYNNPTHASNVLANLVQLGYEVVAFSTYIESQTNRKKRFVIPEPPEPVPLTPAIKKHLEVQNHSLMQLTRLTIELKQVEDLLKVRDALSQGKYDIIAVVPDNEHLFHQSCTDLNIDIISLDCTSSLGFVPMYKLLSCASRRGICFEICYSPMIRDSAIRNSTISTAHKLSRIRTFSNLVLSSGCEGPMELRGPYDVANLNCLLGIPESSFTHTVSKNCRAAVVHGFVRKTAKGAIYVQKIDKSESEALEIEKTQLNDITEHQKKTLAAEEKSKTNEKVIKKKTDKSVVTSNGNVEKKKKATKTDVRENMAVEVKQKRLKNKAKLAKKRKILLFENEPVSKKASTE